MKTNLFEIVETDGHSRLELKSQSNEVLSDKQAWKLSIKKWEFLLRMCEQGKLIEDGGVKTCGLCAKYFYGHADECEECPIKEAGFPGCSDTPYKEYLVAVKNGNLELAKQAALDEVIFLRRVQDGT